MKLFIIPWVMLSSSVHSQNAPNPQFVDIPFYQFLQRQNQINNAILLNNAMLANSLGAVPNEHRLRIPNAIPFHAGSLQTSLPSNPALFQNFPQTVPAVPATGLNRLGIYDVLNRGLDPMNAALVPTQSTTTTTTASTTSTSRDERLPTSSKEGDIKEPDTPVQAEPLRKVNLPTLRQDGSSQTSASSLSELIEEIGEEPLVATTAKVKQGASAAKPRPDVYKLLRTLNLTEEETNDLVNHVEKVVREELVKKLSEAKLIAENSTQAGRPNTTAKSLSSTESTVEAVTAEESRSGDRITIPLKRTKPEKHLLLYIPRKKTDTEIKHHPQRIDDKSAEDRTDFVEAEILTSQMHLPIEERYDDERSDDDPSAATNEPDTSDLSEANAESEENRKVEEQLHSTTASSTITTSATRKPLTTHPKAPGAVLHVRDGSNVTTERNTVRPKSYGGDDADLLNIGLATGAPLDIESEASRLVAYRTRNMQRASSPPEPTTPVFPKTPIVRTKNTAQPKTTFERLAVDYKERLTGAGDMDKILKSLYSNAYIALVDAKDASNVRIPLSMRRAELRYG